MRNKLLISASAIALIAGANLAAAQGMKERSGASSPPPASQTAPAEKMAPGTTGAGAQETPDAKGGAERQDKAAPKTKSSQKPANDKGTKSSDSKSGQTPANKRESVDKGSRTGPAKAEQAPAKGEGSTTGQGPAGQSGASLTTEQRTKITTIIKQRNVQPVTNVNFSISVGAVVPASVRYYPLPVEVVEVYPEWRGYLFILVGDEIVVIHPQSHRIVAVLAV